jgi:Rad3-related DNA helicase
MEKDKNSSIETTNFNFPFKPYNIQEDFMKALVQVLDKNKFGIFESRK